MAAPFVASAPCSHTPGRRQLEDLEISRWVRRATGLHNRRAFILLAEQTVKEAARVQRSVIGVFLDVDHLKVINDTHGHAEGDRALYLVTDALRAACRESDIVGRLSGDEFAILLAETDEMDGLEGSRLLSPGESRPGDFLSAVGEHWVARCEADKDRAAALCEGGDPLERVPTGAPDPRAPVVGRQIAGAAATPA